MMYSNEITDGDLRLLISGDMKLKYYKREPDRFRKAMSRVVITRAGKLVKL